LKQRTGDPWKPADRHGRELPPFTVNLVVRDVQRAVGFLTPVLNATVHYADPDFAAINVGGVEMMLHAAYPRRAPRARGRAPRIRDRSRRGRATGA